MRPVQPERVEQPDPVVRHVLNSVRRRGEVTAYRRTQVRRWRVVQVRGQPYVTVVVAHHEEVLGGQRRAQLGMPAQHLGAQTRHEQQRATARCTERLVAISMPLLATVRGCIPISYRTTVVNCIRVSYRTATRQRGPQEGTIRPTPVRITPPTVPVQIDLGAVSCVQESVTR